MTGPAEAKALLARLRGGLIVSVQPEADSVLNTPETVALLCRCAVANGAAGVRVEGGLRIAAVRAAVSVPIIGLIKRTYPGYAPYITPSQAEIDAVVDAGADIVAFDATGRARPDGRDVAAVIGAIHARGAIAMADGATIDQLIAAGAGGAEIVATTLCGYTEETRGAALPAFHVAAAVAATGAFTILEGGVATPADVRAGIAAGAAGIVVGTALSNIDGRIRAFATEVRAEKTSSH
jgi:N-acylglucosamine-6-phosphate 2-epimerase